MVKANPTRKQFPDKNRAVELAASIIVAQEQKSKEKLEKRHAQTQQAPRPTSKSSSKARLKETMSKLAAQKAKVKAKKRKDGGGTEGTTYAMPRTPEEYVAYLSKRRSALAHFHHTEETMDTFDSEAMLARRRVITAALHNAKWDPADGRWTEVAHSCRLAITRGRHRWLGTRVERRDERLVAGTKSPHPVEKKQKKRNDESRLIQKVESWKQTITREMANNENRVRDSPGTQAPLAFIVAKRSAFTNVPKSSSRHVFDPQKPQTTNVPSPESSFLPPSFPSHLVTSTQRSPERQKPPPIPHNSSPSLVLPNVHLYGRSFIPAEKTRSISKADPSWDAGPLQGSLLDLLDESDGGSFNPLRTSTRKKFNPGEATPSRSSDGQWDHRFDIDQRVGEVAKLLEDDVGLYRTL